MPEPEPSPVVSRLLVVTIDSLRFDYVSRTNPTIRTPDFDRVAGEGLLDFIPTCFSVSSATRPVHTSLFSGLYPFEHGIEGQRDGVVRDGTPRLLGLMEKQDVENNNKNIINRVILLI